MDYNKLFEYLDAVVATTANMAIKYGPAAWETVLWIKRIEGVKSLMLGLVPVSIAVLCYMVFRFSHNEIKRWIAEYEGRSYSDNGWCVFSGLGLGGTAVFSVVSLFMFLNIWNWVAVFYPELAIAKDAIDMVLKK